MVIKFMLETLRAANGGVVERNVAAPGKTDSNEPVGESFLDEFVSGPRQPMALAKTSKFMLETLRMADGGVVECNIEAPDGTVVRGIIDESFFDEFASGLNQMLTPVKRGRIVQDNLEYLELEADRLWREGRRELHIK